MAPITWKEGSKLSKLQKCLLGVIVVCVAFFGFVIVRIGIAQPSSSVKLAQIPTENNAHLGMEAFKEAYPLEYESYKMTASADPDRLRKFRRPFETHGRAGDDRKLEGLCLFHALRR